MTKRRLHNSAKFQFICINNWAQQTLDNIIPAVVL